MSIPRSVVRAALVVAGAFLCLAAQAPANRFAPAPPARPSAEAPYVPGQLLVKFKADAGSTQRASLRQALDATTLRRFRQPVEQLQLGPGLTTAQALELCRDDPRIEYAEPNYIVYADVLPNDARFGELYGLRNTGQTGGNPGSDISAEQAWDVTTGSRDVIVAVIDSGIDYNHSDLAANIWSNPGEIPNNELDDDGNGYIDDIRGWDFHNEDNDPFDDNFHGTHVAGTIGAIGDNGIGVAGISWKVTLVPLKFLNRNGSGTTADAVLAVEYATMIGADITNNSWGGGGFSQSLRDAIAAGQEQGVLFVGAAGNAGRDNDLIPHYPSSYDIPAIIAVAATDDHDELAGFSSYGATSVDLAAPGVEILSTFNGDRMGFLNGTSMATPHVSGVAALIRAVRPDIDVLELKQLILDNVDPVPGLVGVTLTGGRLNAFAPLAFPDEIAPGRVADLTAEEGGSNSVRLTWTATGDDGDEGRATRYDVRYATTPVDELSFAAAIPVVGPPSPGPAGSTESMEVNGLDFATTYYFALRAKDDWNNTGELSNSPSATTEPPPSFSALPDTFEPTLFMGQSLGEVLTIENVGDGTLDWELTAEPDDIPATWLSIAPASGRLLPGESDNVILEIDTLGLPPGAYQTVVRLATNDPLLPMVSIPVALEIRPAAVIQVAPERLDWGQVFVGAAVDLPFEVINAGLDPLTVSVADSSDPSVSVAGPPFTLLPGERRTLVATFEAEFSMELSGALSLSSDAPNAPVLAIPLSGSAGPPPEIGFFPTFFFESLRTGESRGRLLQLTNPGQSDLEVVFRFDDPADPESPAFATIASEIGADGSEFMKDTGPEPRPAAVESVLPVLRNGGFESGDFSGWAITWNGIQQRIQWTIAPAGFGIFGNSQPREGQFSILNGFDGAAGLEYTLSKEISIPIALTRAELEFYDRIQYDSFGVPSSLPRIYEATIQDLDDTVLTEIFREEIMLDGSQYTDLGWQRRAVDLLPYSGRRVRLHIRQFVPESFTGPANIEFDAFRILAEGFPPWLSVLPANATIPPGQNMDIELVFDARGLGSGVRNGAVRIDSNIPNAPPALIPVELEITGAPDIVLPGADVVLDSVQTYDTAGARTQHAFAIDRPPIAGGTVRLVADGDFGFYLEEAAAIAEGLELGSAGVVLADCVAAEADLPIGATDLAALAIDGIVEIDVQNLPGVDTQCDVNEHRLRLTYQHALDRIDFGVQLTEADGYFEFVVANAGTEPLNVDTIEIDSAEFSISPQTLNIPPGGSESVSIVFRPVGAGTVQAMLTLTSDDPDTPELAVPVLGEVVDQPLLTVTPAQLEPTVFSGDNALRTLTLSNAADFELQFEILQPTAEVLPIAETYSGTLPSGESLEIRVLFRAGGLSGGVYDSTLIVTSDDPTGNRVVIPTPLTVIDAPHVEVDETIEFGELFVGATRELELAVTNEGSEPLNVLSTSSDLPEFVPTSSVVTVAPGQTGAIGVAFSPSAFAAYAGTLTVMTDDPSDPLVTVAMNGFGEEPPILELFPEVLVDTLAAGQAKTRTLTFSNAGQNPLEFSLAVPEGDGFVRVSPASGSVPALASIDVEVLLNAVDLIEGSYASRIQIATNDPVASSLELPVEIGVSGIAQMVAVGTSVTGESFRTFSERGAETTHLFDAPVPSFGPGVLEVVFVGDFGNSFEGATVLAEGLEVGGIQETGADCSPVTREFSVDPDTMSQLTADGQVHVVVRNSGIVDPFCATNSHSVRLRYTGFLDDIDFGEFLVGATRHTNFTVENPGTATLNVSSIASDVPGVTVYPETLILPPGESAPVDVAFSPESTDLFEGTLTLIGNAPDNPTITRTVRGVGLEPPILEIEPDAIAVTLQAGDEEARSIVITNVGTGVLTYAVEQAAPFIVVTPSSGDVPPAGAAELEIGLDSDGLLPGEHRATVRISTNDPVNGTRDVAVTLTVISGPNLEAPPSIAFGRTFLDTSSSRTISVSNSGTELLVVSSIAADDPLFTVEPASLTLAPGDSAPVAVTFSPAAAGSFATVLRFQSNDPAEAERTVDVSGSGIDAPNAELDTSEVTGSIAEGGKTSRTLSLTNTGEGTLQFSFDLPSETATFVSFAPSVGSVLPSGSVAIDVRFDAGPLAPGTYAGPFQVTTDDPNHPAFDVTATLVVTPAPNLQIDSTEPIDFGTVFVGQIEQRALILRNEGTEVLEIASIDAEGPEFAAAPASLTITPGQTTSVGLTFGPGEPVPSSSTLRISGNDPDTPLLSILLSGTGETPPAIEVVADDLNLTLDELDETARTVTVVNIGDGVLNFTATVNPPLPGLVAVGPAVATLEPGENTELTIEFAATSPGIHQATIEIRSNDPVQPLTRLPLTFAVVARPILSVRGRQTVESVLDYSGNSGAATSHSLPVPVVPCCGGTIELIANGDFGDPQEFATATAEGLPLGTAGQQGVPCGVNPSSFSIEPAVLAELAADGVIEIDVQNSFSVDTLCLINRHTVRLTYPVPTEVLDFGQVFTGTSRSLELSISNQGSDELVIHSIAGDSPEFVPAMSAMVLEPRTSGSLNVEFSPSSAGTIEATLTLASNDPERPFATLPLIGTSIASPDVNVDPEILTPTVAENDVISRTLTVGNTGGSPLIVAVAAENPGTASTTGDTLAELLPSSQVPLSCVVADTGSRSLYGQAEEGVAFYRFDSGPDRWHRLADAPIEVDNNCGAAIVDGRVYTAYSTDDSFLGVYEIATDTWSTIDHPLGLNTAVIAGDESSLYMARGRSAVRYDPLTTEITPLPDTPIAFDSHGGLRLFEGRLYGHQGGAGTGFVAFDLASETWSFMPSTPGSSVLGAAIDPVAREFVTMGPKSGNNIYRFSIDDNTWRVADFPFFNFNDGGLAWIPGSLSAVYLVRGQQGTNFARIFSGRGSPEGVVEVIPPSAILPPGDSIDFEVRFDAGGILPGLLQTEVVVRSDDPDEPIIAIPTNIFVKGIPDIEVSAGVVNGESVVDFLSEGAETFHLFSIPRSPAGGATLEVTIQGDFGSSTESATVLAEGTVIDTVESVGPDCRSVSRTYEIDAESFAALAADDRVELEIANSPAVGFFCAINRHTATLSFRTTTGPLELGTLFVGESETVPLRIDNRGKGPLEISSISSFSSDLTVSDTALLVPPKSSTEISVTYTPTTEGPFNEVLRLTSNDRDQPVVEVIVEARAIPAPQVVAQPDSLEATLPPESDRVRTAAIRVSNAGAGELTWGATAFEILHPTNLWVSEWQPRAKGDESDNGAGSVSALHSGGPDAFGYRFRDSDEPDGPVAAWVDITEIGTPLALADDDENSGPVEIGFDFPFYGGTFDTANVCTNGWLSFTSDRVGFSNPDRLPSRGFSVPGNLLAPFWDDLTPGAAGSIRYHGNTERFVVQYTDVDRVGLPAELTFQVVLYPSGRIVFQYLSMAGTIDSATIGIQNADKTIGLLADYNTSYVRDDFAVEFMPVANWLALEPTSGVIPPQGFADIVVELSTEGLTEGEYSGQILVHSNDPTTPTLATPVTLRAAVVEATSFSIDPGLADPRSAAELVRARVQLPPELDPREILIATVALDDSVFAEPSLVAFEDANGDGIEEIVLKFRRRPLLARGFDAPLTISGEVDGRTWFRGTTTVPATDPENLPR